jgi:phosphate transport system ATP-binding protein
MTEPAADWPADHAPAADGATRIDLPAGADGRPGSEPLRGGNPVPGFDGPGRIDHTSVIDVAEPGYAGAVSQGPLVGLESRDVSAWFGDHKVLERVSLTMNPGKVTALIGPSGCGKSTFLRILNRLHEMVRGASLAGEVLLGDEDIYDPRRRPADIRRRIGMVFQKPNPFPAMSVYDNVISGLKLAGIKVANKDYVVETSLRRAGLWNEMQRRLRSPGGALSGGQQQRLCIARSLAVSPDVLLMDEPCSALDPTSTRRVEETIRELVGQVTIVIVTHNMQQAQRVSSHCAFFLAAENTPGHIVEHGPTEQLFDDPKDPRTADYVHGRFG